jgi:hypothetical protein
MLLKVRSATAIIVEGAEANVVVMKFLGTKQDVIFFAKFCQLIRCVQRCVYSRS